MENDALKRTLWCGNLPENISDEVVYELFHQAGPLDSLNIPRDKEGRKRNFCFIVYTHIESLCYALEVFKGTTLFGRKLSLQPKDRSVLNYTLSEDLAYLLGVSYPASPDFGPQNREDVFRNVPNQIFNTALQFASEPDPIPQDPYGGQQFELATASLQGHWNSHLRPTSQDKSNKRFYPYRDERMENNDNDKHKRNKNYNERSYDRPKSKYSHRNDDYEHDRRNYPRHRKN